MEWIMSPLNGFKTISSIEAETCPHTWIQCSCPGGLLVCSTPGALVKPPDEPE